MMHPFEQWDEFRALLDALCEETIGVEQVRRLEELVLAHPEAEAYYVQFMNLHADFHRRFRILPSRPPALLGERSAQEREGSAACEGPNVRSEQSGLISSLVSPRSSLLNWRWRKLLALAAALLLCLGWSMFYLARQVEPARSDISEGKNAVSEAEAVAVLTCAVQPEWEGESRAIGSEFQTKERLRLRSGVVQLEFFSGAVLVIEGPADFELLERERIYCREGRMRARVTPPGKELTIESPAVELVDRGTEFGFCIDRGGGAEVHVFDGKVELRNVADNSRYTDSLHLAAGSGVGIDANGVYRKITADPNAFVSAAKLEQQWRVELQRRHKNWLSQSQKLCADSRLVLYYTFQDQRPGDRTLRNRAIVQKGNLNGAIVGCTWSEGRWPGKGALDFKKPSDRVRLQVPGEYQSLTYLAWVRVDAFDQFFSALMLTDGFDDGAPHWQLTNQGMMLLGVKGRITDHNYYSQAFLKSDKLGEWLQLATVYDYRSQAMTHYVDGRSIAREDLRFDIALRIGNVEIGNWGRPRPKAQPQHVVRNFNGRIDEFALFREALSAEEIQRLYEIGKASP